MAPSHPVIDITNGAESLKRLQEWLPQAKHDISENGNRKYEDTADLEARVMPLLRDLGLQHLGYTVWRISTPITIENTTGPGYLIPIQTISGEPCLELEIPQKPGQFTKYDSKVDLTPELDCVFVVPLKR